MEGKKYLLSVAVVWFSLFTYGQINQSIYKAYASGNMNQWKSSMDSIEAIKQKNNQELLDLVNYQYGYIAWCIGKKYSIEAERYIYKALENIKVLEQKKYKMALLYAYKAAFVGFEIGLSPYKAPFIGPKSIEFAQKSVYLDSTNVLGFMQLGNIAFYTPELLGGSKNDALKHYLKALKIMESNNVSTIHNWNYLNLLVAIVHAYMDLNQYEAARSYCQKTLAFEPGFDWVKNKLYPQVLKKM